MPSLNIQNTLQTPPVDYRHCWHTHHKSVPAGIKGRASARDHHPWMHLQSQSFPFPLLWAEKCWDPKVWKTCLHAWSNWDSYALFIWIPSICLISCSNQREERCSQISSCLLHFPRHWLGVDNWGHLCSSQLAPELGKRMVGRREELVTHKRVCAQTQGQQTVNDLWGRAQRGFVVLPFGSRTQHVNQGVF